MSQLSYPFYELEHLGEGGHRCCCRPRLLNKQICQLQNVDFSKTVPKAADFIFAGAVIFLKIYVKVRRLTLFCHRKKTKKSLLKVLPNISFGKCSFSNHFQLVSAHCVLQLFCCMHFFFFFFVLQKTFVSPMEHLRQRRKNENNLKY